MLQVSCHASPAVFYVLARVFSAAQAAGSAKACFRSLINPGRSERNICAKCMSQGGILSWDCWKFMCLSRFVN